MKAQWLELVASVKAWVKANPMKAALIAAAIVIFSMGYWAGR